MSDQLIRAISSDGRVKAVAVSTRDLTERARQIHKMGMVLLISSINSINRTIFSKNKALV